MKSGLAISAVLFTVSIVSLPMVFSDSDYRWDEGKEHEYRSTNVATSNNPIYKEECGSCHMVYPADLLPSRSWSKIMLGLENHFGDNAELDTETYQTIEKFLLENSADNTANQRSRKMIRSIKKGDTPMRISDIPYFKHEHDEIPDRMVKGNTEVNSFSNCSACHAKAEQGSFNEHNVIIPGYGRWDD